MIHFNLFVFFLLMSFSLNAFSNEKKLSEINSVQKNIHKAAYQSQKKIDQLSEKERELLENYRLTLKKIYNTKIYNTQMQEFIKNQKKEMISLRKQIEEVKDTGRDIIPLMLKMLDNLEILIQLDIPFHMKERKDRLAKLKKIINRSDVSISEKYRKILSAYKIEKEYGKTISTYRKLKNIDGRDILVDYIRIGRLTFLYQSLDKKHTMIWDKEIKNWKELPSKYKKSIDQIIKVAKKQIAPNILTVPISKSKKYM